MTHQENSICLLCVFLHIRSSVDPTFCGIFVCGSLQLKFTYFGAVGLLKIRFADHFCTFLRLVLSVLTIFSFKSRLSLIVRVKVVLNTGAPNENVVQNHLNIALLNVF